MIYTKRMSKIYSTQANRLIINKSSSKEGINKFKKPSERLDEVLVYAQKENIALKRKKSPELLRKDIEIIMNLRKIMKPLEPDTFLKNYLGNDKLKIVPIESSAKREGTAVHIINNNHKEMYTDKKKLATITTNLEDQEVLALGVIKEENQKDRFIYAIKLDEQHSTIMILDKTENDLELVTAFAPTNTKAQKILEKCCIIFNNLV
ncbi:MAG: hypothetical protein K2O22_02210 [Anaeroplasmataceae bacterium]|nr:hypothetical protein [Anaeroplasmataceae bacterium]